MCSLSVCVGRERERGGDHRVYGGLFFTRVLFPASVYPLGPLLLWLFALLPAAPRAAVALSGAVARTHAHTTCMKA